MSIRNKLLEDILAAISSGGGILPADNFSGGFFDYNDAATSTTPISVPTGLVDVVLTNDELGAFTNKNYPPIGVTDIWDSTTNSFDFSQLSLGDMIDIRVDLQVTTTQPNQTVVVDLELAQGGSPYRIPFMDTSFKLAGPENIGRFNGIYMGDDNTRLNPAQFLIKSDSPCTVVVRGWYCKIIRRG